MTYATVHLYLTPHPVPTSSGAIRYACGLASLFESRLAVSSSHLSIRAPRNWITGAMTSKMARDLESITTAKTQELEAQVRYEAQLAGIQVEIAPIAEHWPLGSINNAWRGRVSDLCILGLPPDGIESRLHIEDWLFGAGRPCILYPDASRQSFSAKNVLICWDYSRAAARAVSDALPFLHNAGRIRIAVFRGEKDIPVADPVTPLISFLGGHGIAAEAEDVTIDDRTIGAAILAHAQAAGTNLIVMGAFGHARMSEFLLGGATRELLVKSTVPMLMSH